MGAVVSAVSYVGVLYSCSKSAGEGGVTEADGYGIGTTIESSRTNSNCNLNRSKVEAE